MPTYRVTVRSVIIETAFVEAETAEAIYEIFDEIGSEWDWEIESYEGSEVVSIKDVRTRD